MCGIVALIEPGRRFERSLLEAMGADIAHRGPDASGIFEQEGLGLVFRRLSILDPTPRADQPMSDPGKRATLVFNGEIYNFRELRTELETRGVKFRTTGDSEVILQGYLTWGEEVFDRLEGMYALVIHDAARNRVVAARDPFGIKPLYFTRAGKLAAFSSEMRPLARVSRPEPDPEAVAELLTFGWAAGSLSNIKGVERVPGGTLIRVSLEDGSVTRRRFCDPLDMLGHADRSISPDEAEEMAHEALRASVKAHLVSDVGYTVQLSGGVDSSLVTAMACDIAHEKLTTFAVKLDDDRHDEARWREMVTAHYDVDHHEIPLDARDFADALPRAVRHMEGPSPHMGCVLLMLLCDEIAKVSKVVLTGEGADEFFGGYLRFAQWKTLSRQEKAGHWLPSRLLPARWPFLGIRRLSGRDAAEYASVYHDFNAMNRLLPELVPAPGFRGEVSRRFSDFRDRLLAVDQSCYLESLLVRQDKMAMAASVEARVPFVHLPLARVLNSLPHAVRVPGGRTKPLLKAIGEKYLPVDLLHRRKVGLTLPFEDWLRREDGLGRFLPDLIDSNSRLAAYTDRKRLAGVVESFRRGETAGLPDIVRLVNVETWLRSIPAGAV